MPADGTQQQNDHTTIFSTPDASVRIRGHMRQVYLAERKRGFARAVMAQSQSYPKTGDKRGRAT